VAGLLRGVEQACRDGAAQGLKLLAEKLSFAQTLKILFGRARWQREFQSEIETKAAAIGPTAGGKRSANCWKRICAHFGRNWHDMIDQHWPVTSKPRSHMRFRFARQRRELLQSIQLTLSERVSGKTVEEQLAQLFRETSARLRVPAGVAAAGGIAAVIAAMTSAAVADVTGVLAASAAIIGTIVALSQRRKILRI